MAAIVYTNTTLTGVALAVTGQHTVAFAGTGDGSLKKLLITNSMEAEEFEQVIVDSGNPMIADVALDPTQQYVYAASPYKISKIRIEACQQYNTCDKCLQARNPYCGWCSLERRCTIKAACQNATWSFSDRSSPRWLSLETKQCIDFQAVRPDQLPYNSMSVVELVINQLPQLPYGAHYLCVFGESAPIQARVTHTGLACMTPLVTARPPILPTEDHVIVNLAVRSSETETDFIHRPFVFYNCEVHKTCKACVTSTWACSWCVHENTCTSNATTCSRRVIVGESNPQNSLIKGRQHCPSFNIDDEILLPNGVRKEISIGVKNLLTPLEGFQCVVEIEGAKERVFARVRDNTVICAENMYTYEAEIGQVQASLTVLWNGDTFIDKTNVTLYKCHLLGSHGGRADCSLCMTRERKYQCAWCGTSCSYSESCVDPVATSCPPPHIDWIHPLSGPLEGGTLVTIEGSNLGSSEEEIQDKVTIGGIPCIPVEYSISVRTGVNLSGPMPAVVVVGNRAGVTRAQEKFHYKAVELNGVYPNVGPQSGGTRLYLKGSNLNIGSQVEITLDDDLPCRVERSLASSSQISCRTTRSPVPSYVVSQLILRIDGANITYPNPFTYTSDPTLRYIHPLKSFMSGGRYVKVMGTNLTSVQQPRMVVFNEHNVVNETVCEVTNASTMLCPSPAVRPDSLKLRSQHWRSYDEMRLKIGFVMDDVQPVREMQNYFPTLPNEIIYVPDPKFYVLSKDGVKLYKGESLVIEGENMRLASTEGEINVTIGTRSCNLTSLSMTQLVCLPPEVQPPGTDEMGRKTENNLPLVVVRAGMNLRYQIGYLRYEVAKTYEFPPEAIGGLAAGAAVLIVLSLIILAALRHKSSQAEREYKRIQLQMDTLENSVRSECKQAFAELQTDMSDLNNDIQATGVPTLDHRTFVMKVFFPGVADNPVIEECKQINGPQNMYEIAMAQFEQLLCNRNFLLVFIETLEDQKSFSIRDKVNVASLLMIIFLEKMEYATSILKELLLRLIDKYVGTKHPQLMLRSAIKHQVEKGPVDAITHDARYSLSEERLLREQIEYSPVTIQVIHEDQDEKMQCKVNDCDTISQVKAKILDYLYKNTPFSQRPSIYDVDLEWRHGRGGHLILADEDLTTKVVNGWKRINTLAHYGIRDSAVMCLVARRKEMLNCLRSPFNGPLISGSPHLGNCIEDGPRVRYWHLVKNVDDHHEFQKDHSHKAIPEIFLTRLLSTKGTIQKFVDDFLTTILSAKESLPPAVKWLFDLFDEAAARYGISDPEVVHAWKSNRFYQDVANLPAVAEQEMCVSLQMLSMAHAGEVDSVNALKELYIYVSRYGNQILEALDTDPACQSQHLASKLETVAYTIGGGEASLC
ncbi:UNVERIFIED_CONTAM: PlexB [Trichonephila clavipes]